jgi:plasmid stabilization system protein ParE
LEQYCRAHVLAITQYIARSSPVYAERWSDRVLARTDQLVLFPESGRLVPEAEQPDIRELLEGPYRIIYLVQPSRIDILAVVHGRQDLRWPTGPVGGGPSAG